MFPVVSRRRTDFEIVTENHWRQSQVAIIPKYSAEDTTLCVGNGTGETITFPVPAGTAISISIPGLHYNRKDRLVHEPDQGGSRRTV